MKKRLCLILSVIMLFGILPAAFADGAETVIYDLKTCGLFNPLGINTATPTFDWKMASERIGARQTAYRIHCGIKQSRFKAALFRSYCVFILVRHCDSPKVRCAGFKCFSFIGNTG